MSYIGRSWEEETHALQTGPTQPFRDWTNVAVPNGRAGVYTIWRDDDFVYVGAAGLRLPPWTPEADVTPGRPRGLRDRLRSHASGLRSGDQFCIYVFDRLVLPILTHEQIQLASAAKLSLDKLTRTYVRERLSYRFVVLDHWQSAITLERLIQREGLSGELPLLNPIP
jgi:hypothetical protein